MLFAVLSPLCCIYDLRLTHIRALVYHLAGEIEPGEPPYLVLAVLGPQFITKITDLKRPMFNLRVEPISTANMVSRWIDEVANILLEADKCNSQPLPERRSAMSAIKDDHSRLHTGTYLDSRSLSAKSSRFWMLRGDDIQYMSLTLRLNGAMVCRVLAVDFGNEHKTRFSYRNIYRASLYAKAFGRNISNCTAM